MRRFHTRSPEPRFMRGRGAPRACHLLNRLTHATQVVALVFHCHDASTALSSILLEDRHHDRLALLEGLGAALLHESHDLRNARTVGATKSQASPVHACCVGAAPTHLKQRLAQLRTLPRDGDLARSSCHALQLVALRLLRLVHHALRCRHFTKRCKACKTFQSDAAPLKRLSLSFFFLALRRVEGWG